MVLRLSVSVTVHFAFARFRHSHTVATDLCARLKAIVFDFFGILSGQQGRVRGGRGEFPQATLSRPIGDAVIIVLHDKYDTYLRVP